MGLEETVCKEIRLKHPHLIDKIQLTPTAGKGQITMEGDMALVCLNSTLRTPTRILLRLGDWKCRDFPKLFRIIRKFNWRPYLKTMQIEFEVSSQKSRLLHSGRIAETAQEALTEYFRANALSQKTLEQNGDQKQAIYLRLENDELTLSLDTSGQLLYQRGDKSFRGKAAIRENLASALLLELVADANLKNFKNIELIDPMCGSGTFLTEARDFNKPNNNRSFSYQLFYDSAPVSITSTSSFEFSKLSGFELDPVIAFQTTEQTGFPIICEDLFAGVPHTVSIENRLIITNPPYGKRIKIEGKKALYYKNIIQRIFAKFSPERLGIIIPSEVDIAGLTKIGRLEVTKKLRFFNSGIWVYFLIYEEGSI